MALSVSMGGPALKYFYMLSSGGRNEFFRTSFTLSYQERHARISISSRVHRSDSGVRGEFGAIRELVMEVAQRALEARFLGQVPQEQAVLRFAMGCQDPRLGHKLINNPPISVDEAMQRVRTYQLRQQGLAP